MADRVEIFDVECPPATLPAAPLEVAVNFDPGLVEKVWVVIPDGHAGITGIILAVAHEPVVPFNRRVSPTAAWRFIEGNDESIPFDLTGYPDSGQWSVWLFNEDANAHQWQLRFEVNELRHAEPELSTGPAPIATTASGEAATPEAPAPAGEETPVPAPSGEAPTPPAEVPSTPAPAPEAAPPAEGAEAPEAPPAPAPGEPAPAGEPVAPIEPAPAAEGPEAGEPAGAPGPSGAPAGRAPAPPHGRATTRVETRTRTSHETRPAGGWLPHGARYDERRVDQGQDFITGWRGPIIAAGDGYVIHNLSDRAFPDGFGPHYCVVHIGTGPFAGHDWYIGHCTSVVHDGQHFKEGATLAHADQGQVEGGGWCELGEAPGGVPGPNGNGARWHYLFGTRTITRTHTERVRVKVKPPSGRKPPAHHGKPALAHGRKPPVKGKGKPPGKRSPAGRPFKGNAPPAFHRPGTPGHPPPAHGAPAHGRLAPPPAHAPAARKAPPPAHHPPAKRRR